MTPGEQAMEDAARMALRRSGDEPLSRAALERIAVYAAADAVRRAIHSGRWMEDVACHAADLPRIETLMRQVAARLDALAGTRARQMVHPRSCDCLWCERLP